MLLANHPSSLISESSAPANLRGLSSRPSPPPSITTPRSRPQRTTSADRTLSLPPACAPATFSHAPAPALGPSPRLPSLSPQGSISPSPGLALSTDHVLSLCSPPLSSNPLYISRLRLTHTWAKRMLSARSRDHSLPGLPQRPIHTRYTPHARQLRTTIYSCLRIPSVCSIQGPLSALRARSRAATVRVPLSKSYLHTIRRPPAASPGRPRTLQHSTYSRQLAIISSNRLLRERPPPWERTPLCRVGRACALSGDWDALHPIHSSITFRPILNTAQPPEFLLDLLRTSSPCAPVRILRARQASPHQYHHPDVVPDS
ncbi:hypothetical protein C8Q77DRAFT_709921 [Trametes polyzona]|nr:hypothetical protein C8Q77DRAFT_709921 [Trametes polyzona]